VTSPDQRNTIAHLDFDLECRTKGCRTPAAFYIEWHVLGACKHPSLNAAGNIERWLCDEHTQMTVKDAEKRSQPPFWWRLLRPDPPTCPTCGRKVQHAGDILQIVRSL
jgi:hypothetical protein